MKRGIDKWVGETVKLKQDYQGLKKDTIHSICKPPVGEQNCYLWVWIEVNGVKIKVLQLYLFFRGSKLQRR